MYQRNQQQKRERHRRICKISMFWILLLATFAGQGIVAMPQIYLARFKTSVCTDPETGRELYIGDSFSRPGRCIRVQCLGNLQLWEDSCQIPELRGNCSSLPVANEYLEYPRCCPMYECKTYTTKEHGEVEETRIYDQYGTLRKTDITQVFVINDPLEEGKLPGAGIKTQFEI